MAHHAVGHAAGDELARRHEDRPRTDAHLEGERSPVVPRRVGQHAHAVEPHGRPRS